MSIYASKNTSCYCYMLSRDETSCIQIYIHLHKCMCVYVHLSTVNILVFPFGGYLYHITHIGYRNPSWPVANTLEYTHNIHTYLSICALKCVCMPIYHMVCSPRPMLPSVLFCSFGFCGICSNTWSFFIPEINLHAANDSSYFYHVYDSNAGRN